MYKQYLSLIIGLFLTFLANAQCNFNVNLGNNITICIGNNVTISANVTNSNGATPSYVWTGPSGLLSETSSDLVLNSITAQQVGNYSCEVTINGCSESDNIQVNVFTVNAGNNISECIGNQINFNSSVNPQSNNNNNYNYSWSGPNGFTSNQADPTISSPGANATGNYILTVTSNSCTVTDTVAVNMTVPFTVNAGTDIVSCVGSTINFIIEYKNNKKSYSKMK